MAEHSNSVLYKYTLRAYGWDDQKECVAHYCWLCKCHHTIPRKEWVLLIRTNRFTKKQVLNLVCKSALSKSKYR